MKRSQRQITVQHMFMRFPSGLGLEAGDQMHIGYHHLLPSPSNFAIQHAHIGLMCTLSAQLCSHFNVCNFRCICCWNIKLFRYRLEILYTSPSAFYIYSVLLKNSNGENKAIFMLTFPNFNFLNSNFRDSKLIATSV